MARSPIEKDYDLGNLCISAARSRLVLERQRRVMVEMVRDYAGPYWGAEWSIGDGMGRATQPINLMGIYTAITLRALISKNPRANLSTFIPEAKPIVAAEEDWFNQWVERANVAKTLRRCYLDGMFNMMIAYVGIATPLDALMSGWRIKAGEPCLGRIDFDDYAFDTHARDISESWQAFRTRVPLDAAKKFYGKKAKGLEATEDRLFNIEGDERISVLGRGMYGDNMEYRPMVDLWHFYLPWEQQIVTVRDHFLSGVASSRMGDVRAQALKVQRYIGHPAGPFHQSAFITINGNAMGKGPLQDMWDLHDAVNNIARKQIEQARRQKQVLLVQGGADADGTRVVKTNDGEAVRVDNPENIAQVEFGGPNQMNYTLMSDLIQRASWIGGNFEVSGGLSPQGRTATQEKILNQNASAGVEDLQSTAVDFAASIYEGILWLHHHHPTQEMLAPWSPKGLPEMSVTRVVGPQHRQKVPWDMLRMKIDPCSMGHQSPQQRMQALMQVLQTIILPLAPLAAKSGKELDYNILLQKVGKYLDDPDFEELMGGMSAQPQEQMGGSQELPQPAQKETVHTRVNAPGRTMQGDQMHLRNFLMGNNVGGQRNGKMPQPAGM